MNTQPERRSEKVTVQVDRQTMETLRARQTEIAQQTGVRISLSQAAEATLRRGLESPART